MNKKGVFFEVVVLVGFFFLLFNALIIGLSTDSQTGILVEKSTNVINFEKYLENYNSLYEVNTKIFIENKVNDYLTKFYLQKCPSYNGYRVINSDCSYDLESYLDVIRVDLLEYCRMIFDIDCELSLDDTKITVIANKQNIEIPRNSGLRGKYNYTLNNDFFSSNLEVYKYQNFVESYFSECSDKTCVNSMFNEFSHENFSLVQLHSIDSQYDFFYDFIEEFKKCINAFDSQCDCFDFDLSSIPEEYRIEFETEENILYVMLLKSEIVVKKDLFYGIRNETGMNYPIEDIYVYNEGFVRKNENENLELKLGDDIHMNQIKELSFSNQVGQCVENIQINSTRNIINDFFSRWSGENFADESDYIISINITTKKPEGLRRGVLYYNPDENINSIELINIFEKDLFELQDEEILIELSNLITGKDDSSTYIFDQDLISFLYIVQDYDDFYESINEIDSKENLLFKTLLKVIKKSFPVDYYDVDNVVAFELVDKKDNGYNFSFVLNDKKPPIKIEEANIYPISFKENNYILKISGLVEDIDSLGFYFSETLDRSNLVKYYIGNYDDYQKINDFSVEKVFVNDQGKIAYYNDPANLFVLNSEFAGKSNVEQAHNDPDVSIETNYYFLIENLNNNLLITTFDKNANENRSYYQIDTNSEFNLIPNKTICDIDSFNIQTQSFVCEKPSKTIYGNLLDGNYLENKIYWGCLNSKNEIYSNLNDLTFGFMNPGNYDDCVENSQDLFFLSFYDLNDNLMNFIKEYFERNQGIDNNFLEFLNLNVYKLKKETITSGTSATERFMVEIA